MSNIINHKLGKLASLTTQPKALYLLCFVQMWERFSYYGMRAILLLYLIKELAIPESSALGLYAVYICLVEAGAIGAGIFADKYIGQKMAIYMGGSVIALGHIILCFNYLYLGLGTIAAGSSLFRVNSVAILNELYTDKDPNRSSGFSLFYIGINLGSFLASILCASLAEKYGYQYGFAVAGIGMMIGVCTLYRYRSLLANLGNANKTLKIYILLPVIAFVLLFSYTIYKHEYTLNILPILLTIMFVITCYKIRKMQNFGILILSIFLFALFYAIEEQMGSSLLLFNEKFIDRDIFGIIIPSAALIAVNPFVILALGPIITLLTTRSYDDIVKYSLKRVAFAFLLIAASFALLQLCSSISFVILTFMLIAIAELFTGPVIQSLSLSFADKKSSGTVTGLVVIGGSFANILSGFISKHIAEENASKTEYLSGFMDVSVICLMVAVGLVMFVLKRKSAPG